jgi:hypothetical protein
MPPNHWIPAFAGMTEEVGESQTEVALKVIPVNPGQNPETVGT